MKCCRFDGFGKLKLVDGYQTVLYQLGALICLVVFTSHFDPNNSLLLPSAFSREA